MTHTIELKEILKFIETNEVLIASSSKEQKRMYGKMNGTYIVYHKGEKVLETTQVEQAVKMYNKI